MDNLSPAAKATLEALAVLGNADATEIRETSKKSRTVTDKALKELATAGLIAEVDTGAADGTPARWQLANPDATTEATTEEAAQQIDEQADAVTVTGVEDTVPAADQGETLASEPANSEAAEAPATGRPDTADEHINATSAHESRDGETVAEISTGKPQDEPPHDKQAKVDSDVPAEDQASGSSQSGEFEPDEGTTADAPSGVPVTAVPSHQADRRVLAIRGALGDFPHGATVAELSQASGFAVNIVERLLLAMEQKDAARRINPDAEAGTVVLWVAGEGKASEVDPNPAPPRCHACGQVIRSARTASVKTPNGGTRSTNLDGNEAFGRGELEAYTLRFINARPGHVLTPQVIASGLQIELHRENVSSGAVRNNCTKLAAAGRIQLASESPALAFSANPAPAAAVNGGDGQ